MNFKNFTLILSFLIVFQSKAQEDGNAQSTELGFADSYQKDLLTSRTTSYQTFIYKITEKEAKRIYHHKKWKTDISYFHTLVDSYPTDSIYSGKLDPGHYIRAYIQEEKLKLDISSIQNFNVEILNNSTDLQIRVFTGNGEIIENAKVKIGQKKIYFDSKSQTYRIPKSNQKGLLEITYDGNSYFYNLNRNYHNSRFKRVANDILYETPLVYPWIPIKFVLSIPIDGVKSIIHDYPIGTIYQTSNFFKNLYNSTACIFDDYYCEINNSYRFTSKHKGYIEFSKPIYAPGDTVKFKAFVTKKGRPIKDPIDLVLMKTYSDPVILSKLKPYRKGGFEFKFALSDTLNLKLDEFYEIKLKNKKGKTYISDYFNYEDYELSSTEVFLRNNKSDQYLGDTSIVYVSGKDENDLNLLDGRLEVLVTPIEVYEFFEKSVFVPDTLAFYELPLKPTGETEVKVPFQIFPNVNLKYNVEVTLLNSENERTIDFREFNYYYKKEDLIYTLQNDSIKFEYLVNGSEQPNNVSISGLDGFGNIADSIDVRLPYTTKINPFFYQYKIVGNSIEKTFSINSESPLLNFSMIRNLDSISIQTINPRGIPFTYNLYKSNHELIRGFGKDLKLDVRARNFQNYFLAIQYLWGGKVFEENYKIPLNKDALNVKLIAPPIIYPGQEVELEIYVTDVKNDPVENIDILAFGLTDNFEFYPNQLPRLGKTPKSRELINTFSLNQTPFFQKELKYDFETWKPLAVLDTIEYFNFIFPGNELYQFDYFTNDSTTQISPFVVKDGVIQPIGVVYVDNIPVYFSWSTNEPYSFKVKSGVHDIRLRTREAEFEIENINVPEGRRLIVSFDQKQLPSQVKMVEKKPDYSKSEIVNLKKYSLPYRNNFGNQFGYFRQEDRLFLIKPSSSGEGFVGPVFADSIHFELFEKENLSFVFDSQFEYEFSPPILKLRNVNSEKLMPISVSRYSKSRISDLAWTSSRIEEIWEKEILSRRLNSRIYDFPYFTEDEKARLQLSLNSSDQTLPRSLNTLIFKLDDANFFRVYPGQAKLINNLDSGLYKAIIFFEKRKYAIADSIEVKVNGLNYFELNPLEILPADTFSLRINDLMDEFFKNQNSINLNQDQKNKLYQTYQQQFQYFGEGEVVSGHIYSTGGEPLPGVSVIIKGTNYGTVSDLNGFYSLKVPSNFQRLIFSFVGFQNEEISIENRTEMDMVLTENLSALEEVIVTGYAVSKKSNLTASVSTITSNQLAGTVAGLTISDSNERLQIRGISTGMRSNPLIIIDGVPYLGNLDDINPESISSIESLNSESLVAIYGSRAANGVLVLTSKDGIVNNILLNENEKGSQLSNQFDQIATEANSIRSNFSDEAFWLPKLKTDSNGRAKALVKFPDDITKWKAFAYAMGEKKLVGQTEEEIKAYKPISAQLQIPRFLIEGDSAMVLGKSLNYSLDTVSIFSSFSIDGIIKKQNEISFSDSWIDSLLLVPKNEDSLKVRYSLERIDGYFDGEEMKLPVYPKGIELQEGYYVTLSGDSTVNWEFSSEFGPVNIYANNNPRKVIEEKIEFLLKYPYECNEQLASKLKAMLIGRKYKNLLLNNRISERQVNQVIRKLENYQNNDGIWGWWNIDESDLWISIHVAEALKMAIDEGFPVSINLKKIEEESIWNLMSNHSVSTKIKWLTISTIFGLDINNSLIINELDTIKLNVEDRLLLTKIMQKNEIPISTNWLINSLVPDNFGGLFFNSPNEKLTFADPYVRNTTLALSILVNDSTAQKSIINRIENYLLSHLASSKNSNTFITSNLLSEIALNIQFDSVEQSELKIQGDFNGSINTFPYKNKLPNISSLKFTSSGRSPIFLNAYQSKWLVEPSIDSSSFQIKSRFEENSIQFEAGKPEKLLVQVDVKADSEYVMIEVPIPAGCSYNSKKMNNRFEAHREFYRDKVSIFIRKLPKGSHEFEIDLLPRYSGSFILNPAKVELMYFPVIKSHEGLKRIRID